MKRGTTTGLGPTQEKFNDASEGGRGVDEKKKWGMKERNVEGRICKRLTPYFENASILRPKEHKSWGEGGGSRDGN